MTIIQNIDHIKQLISDSAQRYQRQAGDIRLLAVSKGQPASAIRSAFQAGLRDFGENYWQEMQDKQSQLQDLPITWHFIGPIQSNKAADIACHAHWVHSLDREKIARLLSGRRSDSLPPLNICLQVNLDNEASKSGIKPQELPGLAECIRQLPNLALRGLMAIPEPHHDEEHQYRSLMRLSTLRDALNQQLHLTMDTLSMGMSDDLEPAIRAGSTLVRIGRAIFGERQ